MHNPLNLNGDSTELYNKIRKEYNKMINEDAE